MTLLRSNIEFSKRVFLDRLTTDAQPLLQPTGIDDGPGDQYLYAGVLDPYNFGIGADCSGLDGIVIGAALLGAPGMSWTRQFSTETFPGPFQGFQQVNQATLLASDSPIKVCIYHGGGGPLSHMACQIDGWNMESNGTWGICAEPPEITGIGSDFWNDWWIYPGTTITEDTAWRQPMSYPRGLDYAGGRIAAADLAAAGVTFVCRYVSSGGASLPGKLLQLAEFVDLVQNGIGVVYNWETTADMMLGGAPQGTVDADAAVAYIRPLLDNVGVPAAQQNPVVYFSADFDATPDQQTAINAYLSAAADVLGGPQYVGIYGGYWPLSRALDAGVCNYAWQTEAWSGGNIDSRINIMQRNSLGYQTIDGVQCDIDEAHTTDYGQFQPPGGPTVSNPPAIPKPADEATQVSQLWDQLLTRWDFLGGNTIAEALGVLGAELKVPGYTNPTQGSTT